MPDMQELIRGLKESHGSMREVDADYAAAEALGKLGVDALETLVAALNDSSRPLRRGAAFALGVIGDPGAVEPLVAALEEPDTRCEVVRALGKLHDPRAVEPLIAILGAAAEGTSVMEAAAQALGQIGDVRAVKPLVALLKHRQSHVRCTAISALGEIGDPAARPALREIARSGDNGLWVEGVNYGDGGACSRAAQQALSQIKKRSRGNA